MKRARRNDNRVLYAVALEGLTVTFECRTRGHRSKKTYPERGPRAVARWWLERACKPGGYWAKEPDAAGHHGHLYGECRACDREEAK